MVAAMRKNLAARVGLAVVVAMRKTVVTALAIKVTMAAILIPRRMVQVAGVLARLEPTARARQAETVGTGEIFLLLRRRLLAATLVFTPVGVEAVVPQMVLLEVVHQ